MGNMGQSDPNLGLLKDFFAGIMHGIPRGLTTSDLKYWAGHKRQLAQTMKDALCITPVITMEDMGDIYARCGIPCKIPKGIKVPSGHVWPIMTPKGLTAGEALEKVGPHFNVGLRILSLDEVVSEKAKKTTVRFFKADLLGEDTGGLPPFKEWGKKAGAAITLTERILLGLLYAKMVPGRYLQSSDVCAGSCSILSDRIPVVEDNNPDQGFEITFQDPAEYLQENRVTRFAITG